MRSQNLSRSVSGDSSCDGWFRLISAHDSLTSRTDSSYRNMNRPDISIWANCARVWKRKTYLLENGTTHSTGLYLLYLPSSMFRAPGFSAWLAQCRSIFLADMIRNLSLLFSLESVCPGDGLWWTCVKIEFSRCQIFLVIRSNQNCVIFWRNKVLAKTLLTFIDSLNPAFQHLKKETYVSKNCTYDLIESFFDDFECCRYADSPVMPTPKLIADFLQRLNMV